MVVDQRVRRELTSLPFLSYEPLSFFHPTSYFPQIPLVELPGLPERIRLHNRAERSPILVPSLRLTENVRIYPGRTASGDCGTGTPRGRLRFPAWGQGCDILTCLSSREREKSIP
jgi:hypothetical protein